MLVRLVFLSQIHELRQDYQTTLYIVRSTSGTVEVFASVYLQPGCLCSLSGEHDPAHAQAQQQSSASQAQAQSEGNDKGVAASVAVVLLLSLLSSSPLLTVAAAAPQGKLLLASGLAHLEAHIFGLQRYEPLPVRKRDGGLPEEEPHQLLLVLQGWASQLLGSTLRPAQDFPKQVSS